MVMYNNLIIFINTSFLNLNINSIISVFINNLIILFYNKYIYIHTPINQMEKYI